MPVSAQAGESAAGDATVAEPDSPNPARAVQDEPKASSGPNIEAEFEFVDFGFATPEFRAGDYVIPNQGVHGIYMIIEREDGRKLLLTPIEMEPEEAGNGTRLEARPAEKFEQAHLLKRPESVDYYGGMLATYVYHLLIADGVGQSQQIDDFPDAVLANLKKYPVAFAAKPSDHAAQDAVHTAESFQRSTIPLIVWLSLGGFARDSGGAPMADADTWGLI